MKDTSPKTPDMAKRSRILIQLPRLLNYRVAEYAKIAEAFEVAFAYSAANASEGFSAEQDKFIRDARYFPLREKSIGGSLTYQCGLISAIRKFRPDIVFIQSNVRYLSFWLVLFYCWFRGIPLVGHGQGLYRFQEPGRIRRMIYATHIALSTRYACYTEFSRKSLEDLVDPRKLVVATNTITNSSPVKWDTKSGAERGVLFLGRLRERSGLDKLIAAIEDVRSRTGEDIILHLVGDGERAADIKALLAGKDWVTAHGAIYDDARIAAISRQCFAGIYPGDAGLSVVHYMSLSLPPIVHDDMRSHMGPEPSYILNGENGFLFSSVAPRDAMASVISYLISNPTALRQGQKGAFQTYDELGRPGLGAGLVSIFKDVLGSKG